MSSTSRAPKFKNLEHLRQWLTQARRHRFGPCPADTDLWLAQLAAVAAEHGIVCPFPDPARLVDLNAIGG